MRALVTGSYYSERLEDDGRVLLSAVDMDGEVWEVIMPPNYHWCAEQGTVFNSGALLPVYDLTCSSTAPEILDTWG